MNNLLILALALFLVLFSACSNKQKIPQTKAEIAQAIRTNNVVAIAQWLKNGGDVNQKLENNQLPLYLSTGPKGGFEMTKFLIENGADVNQGAGKVTPLMNASSWVSLMEVELLLAHKADKTLLNEEGKSAAELIGDCGNCPEQEHIKILLQ